MREATVIDSIKGATLFDRPPEKPKPVHVLHVHAGNLYGGVEAMLLTQVRERNLCSNLQTSFALCFDGRFSEQLTDAGATIHGLGKVRTRQPLSVRRARQNLRELLRLEPVDVVVTHSCWSHAIFGSTVRAASVPLVSYLHSPATGRHWLEHWARRTPPDLVLCNSDFTAATSPRLFPETRAETIYCPVAPPEFPFSRSDRNGIRTALQTPIDATVIIQVSRMEAWKGHALHLEALSRLKDLPGWECWQVGGAQRESELQYLEKLKRTARRLGISERVRFLEQRSDVAKLLAAADIFCQPNTAAEPFGIAFIEALYAHLPVVTTDIGGAREIVNDSCGVLVQQDDASSLALELRALIQDPALRSRLGSAGPARARMICDPGAQLKQFQEALSGVLHGRQVN